MRTTVRSSEFGVRSGRQGGFAVTPNSIHTDARMGELRTPISRGAVLLEVVLAITLFLFGSAVVGGAISSSLQASFKIKRQALASDLAQSLLAQIQSRARASKNVPATPCKNPLYKGWTWRVAVEKAEVSNELMPAMDRVTVTVAHPGANYSFSLTQLMLSPDDLADSEEEDSSSSGSPAPTPSPSPSPGGG